ncbi:hypothetical protein D3C76_1210060 [compost metagenome]
MAIGEVVANQRPVAQGDARALSGDRKGQVHGIEVVPATQWARRMAGGAQPGFPVVLVPRGVQQDMALQVRWRIQGW